MGLSVAACWVLAGAAVHPSASRITEREQRRAHDLGHVRLALLTLATAAGSDLRDGPAPARTSRSTGSSSAGSRPSCSSSWRFDWSWWSARARPRRGARCWCATPPGPSAPAATRRSSGRSSSRPPASSPATGLRYLAWVAANERGVIYPTELVGPAGPIDRADTALDGVLQRVDRIGERPVRLFDSSGAEVVLAPIPCRIAPRVRASSWRPSERVPDEVDESLVDPRHPRGARLRRAGAVGGAAREAQRGPVPAARPPQQRRGAHPRARRTDPLPDAVGGAGARLPRRRPRRRRLRPGPPPRRRRPRRGLPRAARARRARDGPHRRRPVAAGRRLRDPRRDRRRAPPRQPRRERDRAHHPRRHRSSHPRGPAPPPGVPRRAHRAVEPSAVPRPRRARPGPHPAQRLADPGGRLHRPRRLQARERQPRARRRRRAAARGGRPAPRVPALRRHAGSPRRRRVRRAPRGRARHAGGDRGRRAHPRRHARADRHRRPRGVRPGEHRHRHPPGTHHHVRRAAPQRRPGHVHGQGQRQGLHRAVRAGDAPPGRRPARHPRRAREGGAAGRHRRRVPADRAPRLRRGGRLRGARSLDPSRAGPGVAGRVRAHRRGHRADRAARPARARAGVRAARPLAGRQPVGAPGR